MLTFIGAVALASLSNRAHNTVSTLKFSGLNWTIKSGLNPMGPGPNLFGQDAAWVDRKGKLHLRVKRTPNGYVCAEIYCALSLGCGTYTFQVEPVTNMDDNCVLGLFTWDDDNSSPANREIDIELSRWGSPTNANAQFVIQPYDEVGRIFRFEVPPKGAANVLSFRWTSSGVDYTAAKLGSAPFQSVTLYGSVPPPGNEKVHLNLWLFTSRPKVSFASFEVIVDRFQFTPLPT